MELLQLLHRNRRIFLEEAGSPPAGVPARLGHHGSMAEGWRPPGSRVERNRSGVRELWKIAARRRETAEESGVLHGCGSGSSRRTIVSRGGQNPGRQANT